MGFIAGLLGAGHNDFQANGVGQNTLNGALNSTADSILKQQNFVNALNGAGGNVFGQQADLANMLSQQSAGGGPNPALAQLANTTGQNIANQGAAMASARGIGSNPGLLARNIGQQGAGMQQQAAGQAAVLRAQQQLAAQQQAAALQGQMINQQQQGQGQLGAMSLGNQGQVFGMQSNQNTVNSGVAQSNANNQKQNIMGGIEGVGQAVGTIGAGMFNQGGQVPGGPSSLMGQWASSRNMKGGGMVPGKAKVAGDSKANDTVKAKLSPGEVVIPRSKVKDPDATANFINSVLGMSLRASK